MSKWTSIRDSIVSQIEIDGKDITESTKRDFTAWLLDVILPIVRPYADKFCAQIREQAETETGWCKARDMIVLPFAIEGGLWLVEKILTKTVAGTEAK